MNPRLLACLLAQCGLAALAPAQNNTTVADPTAPQAGTLVQWSAGSGGSGHCYQAFAVPAGITWQAAQDFAIAHGGYLATLASADENTFVFNLVDDPQFWTNDPATNSTIGPWLGGYYGVGTPSTPTWLWVRNGGPFIYTNWAPTMPGAAGGKPNGLCFWSSGLNNPQPTWGGRAASLSANSFVVEYDTPPTPTSHANAPDQGPLPTASAPAPTDQPVTLVEGDPAPPLAPGAWIKGPPVKQFEKGKVYVVEFWATWCGPCKVSIPHLTELQKKYPGVTFIGQDIWEHDPAAVVPFVQQMGDQMDYRVATDDLSGSPEGKMATTWMNAAGQNGIPTAFLVDKDGKIAWIGSPFLLEPYLQQLLAGTLDINKIAADKKAQDDFQEKINGLVTNAQWDAAIQAAKDFDQAHPGVLSLPGTLSDIFLFVEGQDPAAAQKLSPVIYDALKDDADALNETAWQLATSPQITVHDFPLALKFASRAVELTKGQDAAPLDTLAHIYYVQGEVAKAVLYEAQALDKAPSADIKQQIGEALRQFQLAAQAAGQIPAK